MIFYVNYDIIKITKKLESRGDIMVIRLAEMSDFEEYKSLYYDLECNMLYRCEEGDINPQESEEESNYEFDAITLEMLEKEFERTPEKFAKDIESYRESRIYMVQEQNQVIGFAELFRCQGYRWKLAELCIKQEAQTRENFRAIIEGLIKMPYINVIDVCVLNQSAENRLLDAGFVARDGYFFRRERR